MNKNIRFRYWIVCLAVLFVQATDLFAQISEGGIPPSFRSFTALRSSTSAVQIPVTFDVEALKSADEWQTENRGLPPAVGIILDAHFNPSDAGEWHTLPGGEKIWQLTLRAEGAIALMLYYSDFHIPEGGRLFIYNAAKTHLLGAYTSRTNPGGGRFASEFVAGDALTLEYAAPPSGEAPRLEIDGIGYGYNHLSVRNGEVALRATACEVGVNCEEGDAWQNQKKGVCRMVQRIGSREYLCSASLVNNTAQDLKPYILTAHHCSFGSNNLEASEDDMAQWIFYFHYEREGCSSSAVMTSKTMTGCKKIAVSDIERHSDGLLLLLNSMIPENYNVYYNGWDNRDVSAREGVSIHHPAGDYKVISTFFSPASHYTFESLDGITGGQNAHWNVVFDATVNGHGITEKGSSGAPLFNENKLIVGTLTGGNSTCTDPNGLNLYGKMSYHWNSYTLSDSTRMDVWLDPVRSGAQTLAGRHHAGVMPAPRNLGIVYADRKVRLTWNAPASGKPAAYCVYNNNRRTGQTGELFFEDDSPGYGDRNFSVSAIYDNGLESEPVSRSIFLQEYKTPSDVSAIFTLTGKVAVSWQPPLYEQTIYWGEKNADTQIMMDEDQSGRQKPFYFGQMWTSGDIEPLHRKTLTAIKFMPVRNNTYKIHIAQGNRIYEQSVPDPAYRETNTVALTNPFVIDGNSPLIVSLFVDSPRGYPAYCDAGPAVSGKGDIYSYDGKNWESLYESDHDFNMNFFVAAVVTSAEGDLPTVYATTSSGITMSPGTAKPEKRQAATTVERMPVARYSMTPIAFPDVNGYNIYRNDTRITTASASMRRYIDPNDLQRTSYYQVSVLYGNQESELSAKVEISPAANETVDVETVALNPGVFTNRVEIAGADHVTRIEVYSIDGKLRLQLDRPERFLYTQSWQDGIYIFRIYTRDNVCHTLKGLKSGR
ncbi:MAG: T9SS type A sorting domain-containing protein [Tannerella sp.]|nr:T9SS type A sorting domain-containing protein [Tannerella sp.]